MSTFAKLIAGFARYPVNFVMDVATEIKVHNEAAASKPSKLSDEDLEEAMQLLAAKKARTQR